MTFVLECLYLLDSVILALFGVPVFAVFLGGAVVLVCLGFSSV